MAYIVAVFRQYAYFTFEQFRLKDKRLSRRSSSSGLGKRDILPCYISKRTQLCDKLKPLDGWLKWGLWPGQTHCEQVLIHLGPAWSGSERCFNNTPIVPSPSINRAMHSWALLIHHFSRTSRCHEWGAVRVKVEDIVVWLASGVKQGFFLEHIWRVCNTPQ